MPEKHQEKCKNQQDLTFHHLKISALLMETATKERQHTTRDNMRRSRKHANNLVEQTCLSAVFSFLIVVSVVIFCQKYWRTSKINGRFKAGYFIVSEKQKHITSQHQSAREETKENKKTLKIVMFDSQGTATQ